MRHQYDTIIWGLGAMGSAALYQLAKRGHAVLGIDQFSPPHIYGSSHGDSRIIRQAVGEGEQYVPMILRSYELWKELEQQTGENLLTVTGGFVVCKQSSDFLKNTLACAKQYHFAHEILNAAQARAKFPQFKVQEDDIIYYDANAGFLRPEKCISAQLLLAEQYGATIHKNEKIENVTQAHNGSVYIKTDQAEYEAKNLIIAAGPWLPKILPDKYAGLFSVTRQVLFWFNIKDAVENFSSAKCPIFIWAPNANIYEGGFYGFPAIDGARGGIKIASIQAGEIVDANDVNRQVSEQEIDKMFEQVSPYLPALSHHCLKAAVCLYTNTTDGNFIIDTHPNYANVIFASPCSGHGFKYSSAIGEILAELVLHGKSTLDISAFRM